MYSSESLLPPQPDPFKLKTGGLVNLKEMEEKEAERYICVCVYSVIAFSPVYIKYNAHFHKKNMQGYSLGLSNFGGF